MRGLTVLAPEGINSTVAGSQAAIQKFKAEVQDRIGISDLSFKDSVCAKMPFRWVQFERRSEIVGMKRPDLVPPAIENHHLSPKEWEELVNSPEPKTIIDTRNKYETKLGKFQGAIDPNLSRFSQWSEYLDNADLPKDQPILIYCTGGIRCEKAIIEMQNRGYENVYQLRDGILGYLAEFPNGSYEGECFVFDDRVAVDNNMQPTKRFGICPGCGLTADDLNVCAVCNKPYFVCEECKPNRPPVCSKPCKDKYRQSVAKQSKTG